MMKTLNLKDYLNKPKTNGLNTDQAFGATNQVGNQNNSPIQPVQPMANPQAPMQTKQIDLTLPQQVSQPVQAPEVQTPMSKPQQLVSGMTSQLASKVAAGNQNIQAQNDLLNGDNQAGHDAINAQGQVLSQQAMTASHDLNNQYLRNSGALSLQDQQGQYNYSNWNDIKDKQTKLNAEFLDKGVRDPQQLAQATGLDIDTVNKYLSGQLFSDLQASNNNTDQQTINQLNEQKTNDLNLQKENAQRDFQISQDKLKQTNDRQVQDATNNHNRSKASQQIAAASSGAGQTGGLINGLQAQNTQFDDMMSRVAKQFDWNNVDMHNQYNDFMKSTEKNMDSINTRYKQTTTSIKQQGMSNLINLQQNEVLGTEAYQKGINELISNYTSGMNGVLNNVYTLKQQTIDNANKQSQMIFDQQFKQKELAFDQNYKMQSLALQRENQQQDMQYKYDTLNQKSGQSSIANSPFVTPEGTLDANSIAQTCSNSNGDTQCGRLVNNYLSKITGSRGMGDTYQSKVDTIKKIGQSSAPVVGGVFTYPIKGSTTGHTGIVTGINSDGSINVVEANKNLDGKTTTGTYKNTGGFVFSQAPTDKTSTDNPAVNVGLGALHTTGGDNALYSIAKDVADYNVSLDQGLGKGKSRIDQQKLLDVIKKINPNYNAGSFATNNKTITEYSPSGKVGQSFVAASTAMHHLDQYTQAIQNANNGDYSMVNKLANELGASTGDTPARTLEVIATTVSNEISKTYGEDAEAGKQAQKALFNMNNSPAQAQAVADEQKQLMLKKLQSSQDAYSSQIGKPHAYLQSVIDNTKKTIKGEAPKTGGKTLKDIFGK